MKRITQKEAKKCCTCKLVLPTIRFTRDKNQRDGLTLNCRECRRKFAFEYYEKNKEREREKGRERARKLHPLKKQQNHEYFRKRYREVIGRIFELLGSKCVRCGEEDKRILQIDHMNGGGNKERRQTSKSGLYLMKRILLEIESGSDIYQILCANHNLIEAFEKGYKTTIWQK